MGKEKIPPVLIWQKLLLATDGIANVVNCGTYVKHETIKNLHYSI